jgi:hypothetical protein
MNRLLLYCLLATVLSCSTEQRTGDRNIQIVLQDAQSYRYDLGKGVLTVYYLSKPPTTIPFHLSPKEKEEIIDTYYNLELDRLQDLTRLEDECLDMPELATTINVQSAGRIQKIVIEEDCNSFSARDARKARKVKRFLKAVHSILYTKPEIRTPPPSDIFYI